MSVGEVNDEEGVKMDKITVIDGKSFKIGTHTVRLAGVDARGAGGFLAAETKKYLETLIVNKKIDLEMVGTIDREAVVNVSVDGKSVNDAMNEFLKENGNIRQQRHASMRLSRTR